MVLAGVHMSDSETLRVFVAMPGTSMGPHAAYKDPKAVEKNLLEPVRKKLKAKLGRDVELVIEKDKKQAGLIHASMFQEARDAHVYIADLTGANPNVYLELGVRWALSERVTVPIYQNVEDLKFNVGANRGIPYSPDNVDEAINNIVAAIENGLKNNKCDSPVLLNSNFTCVDKSQLEELQAEVARLRRSRGEDLLHAALATEDLIDRVTRLREAVKTNPALVEGHLELGKAYRQLGKYDDAIKSLDDAERLAPDNALVQRELGVCYSKLMKPEDAVKHLRKAKDLAPKDTEAWSNLGGALRRLGMAGAPKVYDQRSLEEARDSYSKAHELNEYDVYSALNVARLDILLSKWDSKLLDRAKEGFRQQIHLCRHRVEKKPDDYWRRFDLADALLFSQQYDEAYEVITDAIEVVPKEKRTDTIASVLGPLRDYLTADVVSGDLRVQVERIIDTLQAAQHA